MKKLLIVKLLFLILFLIITISTSATLLINEIMYNPEQCSDNYCEWIELYNPSNETINLSDCTLDNNRLEGIIVNKSYFLIVDNLNYFLDMYKSFNSYNNKSNSKNNMNNIFETSISLKNTGENLILTSINNKNCNDSFDYTFLVEQNLANGNNKTLEIRDDGSWGESILENGTPGKKNSINSFSGDFSMLKINEFLPDPFNDDNEPKPFGEWVELYNNGNQALNLNGLILKDENENNEIYITEDKIIGDIVINPKSYLVVYRNKDNDFSLNNYGYDEVRLFENQNLIDKVTFSDTTPGMSWSKINDNWYETKPTPNQENIYQEKCDWELKITMNDSIFKKKDFEFNLIINRNYGFKQDITIKGTIEDYYGKIVKEYFPWTNKEIITSATKTYSPNLYEGIYKLNFWLENLSCSEGNLENNQITKFFAINPKYKQNKNFLEIEKIYLGNDNKAEWADQITTKVNIYKSNDTKTAIELWAEKDNKIVSKRTKINIYDQYKDYTLTLPLQLHPNCVNEDGENGMVKLILKGLGLRDEKYFKVEGIDKNVCKDYLSYIKKKELKELSEKRNNAYEIIDVPNEISPGKIFKIKIKLWSDEKHKFKIWSYLYRGNKCFSCQDNKEKENNLISFELAKNEIKIVELLVQADDNLKDGLYKLMVKINKDKQKTSKNLNKEIFVKKVNNNNNNNTIKKQESPLELLSTNFDKEKRRKDLLDFKEKKMTSKTSGMIIYESNSEMAKKVIPYLLALTASLLVIILLKKDK